MSNVLVVDDEPAICWGFRELLRGDGHEVTIASSAEEALQIAPTCRPDTILLDIQLPGMDGYQVARELRARESLKRIPIIAVTSYAMVGDEEKALQAGCTGYLEKPIDPDTFVSQITALIAMGRLDV